MFLQWLDKSCPNIYRFVLKMFILMTKLLQKACIIDITQLLSLTFSNFKRFCYSYFQRYFYFYIILIFYYLFLNSKGSPSIQQRCTRPHTCFIKRALIKIIKSCLIKYKGGNKNYFMSMHMEFGQASRKLHPIHLHYNLVRCMPIWFLFIDFLYVSFTWSTKKQITKLLKFLATR